MNGRRVRGLLSLVVLAAVGWWIYDRRPTVSGFVDTLTRPLLGSKAAVKEAEHKRVVAEASQVVNLEQRSEEHTSELQSPCNLVCRLLLEKKKKKKVKMSINRL